MFRPFDPVADDEKYVDGKARVDGTRSFLHPRSIQLPEGGPDDPPETETVHGLAARKDQLFTTRLRTNGVAPYPFLAAAQRLGVPPAETAVFEDAIAGVAAGRAGRFGRVIDIARSGAPGEPLARGADIVVQDRAELLGQEC